MELPNEAKSVAYTWFEVRIYSTSAPKVLGKNKLAPNLTIVFTSLTYCVVNKARASEMWIAYQTMM